jgi:hypothetical protein
MALTDDELYDLSDEELEAAFKAAKAEPEQDPIEVDGVEDDSEYEEEYDEETEEDQDGEEEVDDLEQPDDEQDSDDDTSSDDDEEEESEDDSETEEDDPDGDTDEDEEQTDDEEEESEKEEQPLRKLTYKANGQEFEFTEQEVIEKFGQVFGQSMDYTKKMQQIKPWRKTIDALEEAGIGYENLGDLMTAIDVVKGDEQAIAAVLKQKGIDALDLDTEKADDYIPKNYGRDDTELAIKDVVDEISVDKEYDTTHNILTKQWDETSRAEFIKEPEMIKLLHLDVKSGTYDKVNSIAQKMKVFDGGRRSDLDYYKEASGQYFQELSVAQQQAHIAEQKEAQRQIDEAEKAKVSEVRQKQERQKATKKASAKRKAAAPAKKAVNGGKKVTDYLDDSDEGFEEWYNNLQENL